MKHAIKFAVAVLLFLGASPALAADGVLLLGCAEDANSATDGAILVVAAADGPMPLDDGTQVEAADLLGMGCASVLSWH